MILSYKHALRFFCLIIHETLRAKVGYEENAHGNLRILTSSTDSNQNGRVSPNVDSLKRLNNHSNAKVTDTCVDCRVYTLIKLVTKMSYRKYDFLKCFWSSKIHFGECAVLNIKYVISARSE